MSPYFALVFCLLFAIELVCLLALAGDNVPEVTSFHELEEKPYSNHSVSL